MPQHESRPFGVYTEILLLLRRPYERANQMEFVIDATQTPGAPVWRDGGLSFGNYRMFYCHPLDYIWALTNHDLEWYSRISLQWQLWRIDQMARAAEGKLDARLGYLNYGRHDSIFSYFDDVISPDDVRKFLGFAPAVLTGNSRVIEVRHG